MSTASPSPRPKGSSTALSALVVGVGLGAFVDGILFHQILQWHHLVSSEVTTETVRGLERNTLADGIFHAAAWAVTAIGVWLVWSRARRGAAFVADRGFLGLVLVGFALFNAADVVLFHWILGLHNIREGDDELAYDVGYLVLSLALLALGVRLTARAGARAG